MMKHIILTTGVVMFAMLALFVGCFTPNVPNPSGECEAEDDGSRHCYHSPERTDTYLPDCENTLDRELWRVFAQTEEAAYVIPRPDGLGSRFGLCAEDAEHAELFQQYKLCDEILDSAGVEIINNIPPADALIITNVLHQNLVFEVGEDGYLSPWAPDNDMLDACALIDDPIVDEYCENIESRGDGENCLDIDYNYPEEAAQLFADALNQLYGIE